MKLEDQVCSLELAKKLKELGVKQKSVFFHCERGVHQLAPHSYTDVSGPKICSAFTVAELGEMFGPVNIDDFGKAYREVMALRPDQINAVQMAHNLITQPDIAAGMLIYLIENKVIEGEASPRH